MNRRTALKTVAGFLAGLLAPWKARVGWTQSITFYPGIKPSKETTGWIHVDQNPIADLDWAAARCGSSVACVEPRVFVFSASNIDRVSAGLS